MKLSISHVLITLSAICFVVAGCAATRYMSNQVVGNYYLNENRYAAGVEHFREQLAQHPQDALANHYMGRMLLAQNRAEEALPYLEKSTQLDPNEEEFWFWLGVAHWSAGDIEAERADYQRALTIDPKYVPARLYLGHNYKNAGRMSDALEQYDKVLVEAPLHPDALFNRADVLQNTGMRGLAVPAWKKYLDSYPDGSNAREAAIALNSLGDFTYRIHVIGVRQIVLEEVKLGPGGKELAKDSRQSVDVVASLLTQDPALTVEIASYDKAGEDAARYRASAVRNALEKEGVRPEQIRIAAYGRPERIRAGGRIHTLDDSIVFRNPRS